METNNKLDSVAEKINSAIAKSPANSAWQRGVQEYAKELYNNFVESCKFNKSSVTDKPIEDKDLLNGAKDWQHFSESGSSLVYDTDIAERLSTPSELKKTNGGERNPNSRETWLDVQARALTQAAAIVRREVNGEIYRAVWHEKVSDEDQNAIKPDQTISIKPKDPHAPTVTGTFAGFNPFSGKVSINIADGKLSFDILKIESITPLTREQSQDQSKSLPSAKERTLSKQPPKQGLGR